MDQGLQRQGRVRKPETVTRPCCSFRRRRVGGASKAIPGVRQGGVALRPDRSRSGFQSNASGSSARIQPDETARRRGSSDPR